MANYNSVEELFNAGTTNMSSIRYNSANDDSYDTITGVDWFTFNGIIANNIYVSGNSWIGFGSATEHLKVSRNDCKMYYLYKEEGTACGTKFLKLRWQGYSRYNYTGSQYYICYDVVLWETGDISLHMLNIPTSYNGTYSITAGSNTYSYSVSTSSPDVTFKKTDSGFEISNSIINLIKIRYLVRAGSSYYTVNNNILTKLSIKNLNADTFLTHGVTEIPSFDLVLSLQNPELLYWSDKRQLTEGLNIDITPPLPQIAYSEIYTITEGSTIDKVGIKDARDLLVTITFDAGQTWKYFDGTDWKTAVTDSEGMSLACLDSIQPEDWTDVVTSTTFQLKCILYTRNSQMGQIYFNVPDKIVADPEEPEGPAVTE